MDEWMDEVAVRRTREFWDYGYGKMKEGDGKMEKEGDGDAEKCVLVNRVSRMPSKSGFLISLYQISTTRYKHRKYFFSLIIS